MSASVCHKRPNTVLFFDTPEEFYNPLPVSKRARVEANHFVSKASPFADGFMFVPPQPEPSTNQQELSKLKELIGKLSKEKTTMKEQGEIIIQENNQLKQEKKMLMEQGEAIFQENCVLKKAKKQSEAIAGEITGLKHVIINQYKQQKELKQEIHQLKSQLVLKNYEIGLLRKDQMGNCIMGFSDRHVF